MKHVITVKIVDNLKDRNPQEPRVVYADIFGYLAVHPQVGDDADDEDYAVTHIKTGMAVERHLTEAQAFELARRLQSLEWNWKHMNKAPDGIKEAVAKAVRDVRGIPHCG